MTPELGSWNHHRAYGGGFVNKLMDAYVLADASNCKRLRLAFPQIAAARDSWNAGGGDKCPAGWGPSPFATEPLRDTQASSANIPPAEWKAVTDAVRLLLKWHKAKAYNTWLSPDYKLLLASLEALEVKP